MKMDVQKRIAAQVLKCSPKRVVFDSTKLKEIKEAITKSDIRGLIIDGFIAKKRMKGISKFRARRNRTQKIKGRRKGHGSRKGKRTARTPKKESWMNRVRKLRIMLKGLKQAKSIENNVYWDLYRKAKGGFFRSKRHLQLYLQDKKLVKLPEGAKISSKEAKPEKSEMAEKPKKEKPAKKSEKQEKGKK